MPKTSADDSELVTVRVPKTDLDTLRLACQVTGRSMSSEIRQGIQLRIDVLQRDPDVLKRVEEKIAQLQSLYGGAAGMSEGVEEVIEEPAVADATATT